MDRQSQAELILASASPRRHEILTTIGVAHRIVTVPDPSGLDEPQIAGESPTDYVRRTAREKAERVAEFLTQQVESSTLSAGELYVLSADTCVILDDEILGKPEDTDHASRILKKLSAREHTVRTAVSLWHQQHVHMAESQTLVRFAPLSDTDIKAYCATGECWGKAGAYGIQGYAARFVSHLKGSYTGVVGLPAWETIELLRKASYPI